MKRFTDKVAIITGSSNGIGKAAAILFASEGAKVTVTGRDAAALKDTKEQCLKAGATEDDIVEVLGDITTTDTQNKLINETILKFGRLDILVNNHGGAIKERTQHGELDIETFDVAMNLNCKSSMAMCIKALPHLRSTKGCIVNVSSVVSTIPAAPSPTYALAKATLDHLTRILAIQNARFGVRVNAVNPGGVKTTFLDKLGMPKEMQEKATEAAEKAIPFGRMAMAPEIAKPIAFLADNDAASYITGQTLIADGGLSMANAGFCNPQWENVQQMFRKE